MKLITPEINIFPSILDKEETEDEATEIHQKGIQTGFQNSKMVGNVQSKTQIPPNACGFFF